MPGSISGITDLFAQGRCAGDQQQRRLHHHVGDEQRGENVIVLAAIIFQRTRHLVLALPELVEADLLDLRHAEGAAQFLVFLAVAR